MRIQAEVSFYPLGKADYGAGVERFLDLLSDGPLECRAGSMSTLIAGDAGDIFDELKRAWLAVAKDYPGVLTFKASNACPAMPRSEEGT